MSEAATFLQLIQADDATPAARDIADASTHGMRLQQAVTRARDLQARITRGEALLKELHAALQHVHQRELPDLLQELAVPEVRLHDGTRIALGSTVHASLSEERRPDAYAWLEAHGHGDVIKTAFTIKLGKGEEARTEEARRILDTLVESAVIPAYSEKADVHPSTYKALIRELMRDGVELPLQTLGVHIVVEATITTPKEIVL